MHGAERDEFDTSNLLLFADEAVSGAAPSRADFDRMMAAARAGKFKVLYFVNLSRLARLCAHTADDEGARLCSQNQGRFDRRSTRHLSKRELVADSRDSQHPA